MIGTDGELPAPGTRGRRRAGFLLAVFGAVGLVLIAVAFAFAGGLLDGEGGPLGLEGQRRQIVRLLDASETAVVSAQTAARDADVSLGSTATAADSTATLMADLSRTMSALAGSLRISFFGSQPFAPAADDMDRVAAQAGTVAADLQAAAATVRVAGEDMAALATDLEEVRADIAAIRTSMAGPIDAGPWRLLLVAILVWLAIPAAVSLYVGLRWLRSAPVRRTAAAGIGSVAGSARPSRGTPPADRRPLPRD